MTKGKKFLKVFALILVGIILTYLVLGVIPRNDNFRGDNPMMKEGDLPILIAHGGGNKEFPDNTLEAFYNAYGVDERVMMETDVSITKDGVLILSHDTTIDRKTNRTGAIADWNYTDLIAERVDFGYTNPTENERLCGERVHFKNDDGRDIFPTNLESYPDGLAGRDREVFLATTLEELITAFPNNRINVEIKQEGELGIKAFHEALRLLEKHDAYDRVVLASFHSEIYGAFCEWSEEHGEDVRLMYSPGTDGVIKYFVMYLLNLDFFFNDGIAVFQLPTEEYGVKLATQGLVKNAHKHNLAVHFWTINDTDEMRELIEIGADGIMTDYPHRLKEVYDSYNG